MIFGILAPHFYLVNPSFYSSRLFKNKHQAVSQGARRFEKRSISIICEHLQKLCNAGSRPEALFLTAG
jgi:hypothetical protein